MARLTIPVQFRPALASIGSMSQKSFDALVNSLRTLPPASNPIRLASKVTPVLSDLPAATVKEIFSALFSLYNVKDFNEVDVSEFIEDIGRAMASNKSPVPTDIELLKQRFAILFNIPSLGVSAKAFAIQREQQRIFSSARSFSDIRPVFSEDGEYPTAVVIVHQLKLSYLENGEMKEFFVTLDDEDLSQMQKVLTRAQTKSKALSVLIEQAKLTELAQ